MFFRWTGKSNNSWSNPANWIDEDSVPYTTDYPGKTAATIDEAYFDAVLGESCNSCTLTASTLGEKLKTLFIGGSYNGTVGVSGGAIEIAVSGETIIDSLQSTGIWLKGVMTTGLSTVTVMQSNNVSLAGVLGGVNVLRGNVEIGGDVSGDVFVGYYEQSGDAVVTILSPSTITALYQTGGYIDCYSEITLLSQSGGSIILTNDVAEIVQQGGVINWASGTITSAVIYKGLFDASIYSMPRTLTNATLYRNGTINLQTTSRTITLTNPIKNYGGTIITPISYGVTTA